MFKNFILNNKKIDRIIKFDSWNDELFKSV